MSMTSNRLLAYGRTTSEDSAISSFISSSGHQRVIYRILKNAFRGFNRSLFMNFLFLRHYGSPKLKSKGLYASSIELIVPLHQRLLILKKLVHLRNYLNLWRYYPLAHTKSQLLHFRGFWIRFMPQFMTT